jgi:ribosomal protein L7/L12
MTLSWLQTRTAALELTKREGMLLLDQVTFLLKEGATPIDCIKVLREFHGLGLAAGKDLVDNVLSLEDRVVNETLREQMVEEVNVWGDC